MDYYPATKNYIHNFKLTFQKAMELLNLGRIKFMDVKENTDFNLSKNNIERIVIAHIKNIPLKEVIFIRNKNTGILEVLYGQEVLLALFLYSIGKSLGTTSIKYKDLASFDYNKYTLGEFLAQEYDLVSDIYMLRGKDEVLNINLNKIDEKTLQYLNSRTSIRCSEFIVDSDSPDDAHFIISVAREILYS